MKGRIVWPAQIAAWVVANRDALFAGLATALVLVIIMLTLRSVGRRIVASDPQLHSWTAVWARELIMGIIGRQTVETPGETALDNARAVVRVLVSVSLFAIAIIVIL